MANSLDRLRYRYTFVIPSMNGGGAERQMSYLVNHCASQGEQCTLLTLSSDQTDTYQLAPAINRIALNAVRPSRGLLDSIAANRSRVRLLRSAIEKSRPDLVVSFCDQMNILSLAAIGPLTIAAPRGTAPHVKTVKRTKTRLPLVICERSDPRKQKLGWFWERLRRIYYPRCTACVVQTAEVGKYLKNIVGSLKPISVIPTAIQDRSSINPDEFTNRGLKFGSDTKHLLFVGRLSQEKGLDRLLDIWLKLHPQFPQWKLLIAGDGSDKERLMNRNEYLGGSSVEWLGWIPNIQSIMSRCDAFVLPSHYEGFPNALVEAMDCGLPCVATDCSASIAEIINQRESGLIVENSSEALYGGMLELLKNESQRIQFGQRARASVAKFHWESISPLWDRVLESNRNPRLHTDNLIL